MTRWTSIINLEINKRRHYITEIVYLRLQQWCVLTGFENWTIQLVAPVGGRAHIYCTTLAIGQGSSLIESLFLIGCHLIDHHNSRLRMYKCVAVIGRSDVCTCLLHLLTFDPSRCIPDWISLIDLHVGNCCSIHTIRWNHWFVVTDVVIGQPVCIQASTHPIGSYACTLELSKPQLDTCAHCLKLKCRSFCVSHLCVSHLCVSHLCVSHLCVSHLWCHLPVFIWTECKL